jgi:hypothetical protein
MFYRKKLGFHHKMLRWSYQCIALPKMSYAISMWCETLRFKGIKNKLHRAQNCITRAMTSTLRSTPSLSVQAAQNILPITSDLRSLATREYVRLINNNKITLRTDAQGNPAHLWAQNELSINELSVISNAKESISNNFKDDIWSFDLCVIESRRVLIVSYKFLSNMDFTY